MFEIVCIRLYPLNIPREKVSIKTNDLLLYKKAINHTIMFIVMRTKDNHLYNKIPQAIMGTKNTERL